MSSANATEALRSSKDSIKDSERVHPGVAGEDCGTGEVIASEQAHAATKEDVLDVLSRVAGTFRTMVGESLASSNSTRTRSPKRPRRRSMP